jgi:Cu+-exporting ATPase
MNGNGSIECRAEKVGGDTALARIIQFVEEAQGSKAPMQDFADRVASWFVPVVIVIAILTFTVWMLLGAGLTFALLAGVSVLVIACPCALGLATPTAIMVATGQGALMGILIRGGEPLQAASRFDTVVFDKTGTLTKGKPAVTDILGLTMDGMDVLRIAASLEQHSEHPLAECIVRRANEQHLSLSPIDSFTAVPGFGIQGTIDGTAYIFGNRRMIEGATVDIKDMQEWIHATESQGKTVMLLADEKTLLGIIAVADTPKETSRDAIAQLRKTGVEVYMITGDNRSTAQAIATTLDIPNVLAEVRPEEKANEIKTLQAQGRRVAMVGDGINDSPALAQADVGIAMGSGTDIAMETGGIVLVKNDPRDVTAAIELSRAAIATIRQNLFFALFYNVIGIPIAARLFVHWGIVLRPELAGLAMAFSSVSVVSNSLLLKRFRPGRGRSASIFFTFLMLVACAVVFYIFARISV